ncbi:MAG: sigma 54-interacting transcriptional regulator [Deltaproteobacteria bacterium]|nr:sigma 54-interacting transcriptional regulator [Deltaproteobacteria bacterium]
MKNFGLGVTQDVEEILKRSELAPIFSATFKFFLNNPYESLIIVDKEGKIVFIDRGSEKFFGLPKGSSKGLNLKDLVPNTVIFKVLDTGYPIIGRLFEIKGKFRISSVYPLFNEEGKVIGALGRILFRSMQDFERIGSQVNDFKKEVRPINKHQRDNKAIYNFEDILGISKQIKNNIRLAKRLAMFGSDILIFGETGTGKELFSQAIHNFIDPGRPFIRINSPAIPFELAESELFGYVKGAFTGANTHGKRGKFELGDHGTIFIDEIPSMHLSIQAKLLRVIEEREIERIGGTQIKKLNFKMISTTNLDLRNECDKGRFRKDLYYRLAKSIIKIPPLRERKEDIPVYIDHYMRSINTRFGTRFKKVSDKAMNSLINYDWPGNVRELINAVEQSILRALEKDLVSNVIPENCLQEDITRYSPKWISTYNLKNTEINNSEKEKITHALKRTMGNKRRAALLLNMPRSTLYNKLKKYNI